MDILTWEKRRIKDLLQVKTLKDQVHYKNEKTLIILNFIPLYLPLSESYYNQLYRKN